MNKLILLAILIVAQLAIVTITWANETTSIPNKEHNKTTNKITNKTPLNKVLASLNNFEIRADGLACPYCAYGIEKKFKEIKGVKNIDVDLKKGLVKVSTEKTVKFSDKQLITLFSDSGFTFRSIKKVN